MKPPWEIPEFNVAIVVAVMMAAGALIPSCVQECKGALPGERAFEVTNGLMEYLIDPLNEVCLAQHMSSGISGYVPLAHEDCLRLIRRYKMPLPELKPEAEERELE